MRGLAGILLPESVLVAPWFLLLATMVAFNTIIYVGLTLAKLIPWPQQFHPSRVRDGAARLGMETTTESLMRQIPQPEQPESEDPYEVLRLEVARRDIPQAFALTGGLVVVVSFLFAVVFRDGELWANVYQLGLGVVYLVSAVVLGQREFRGRTMMWAWAMISVVLVLLLVVESVRTQSQLPLTYGFVMLTAFAPVTLGWRPTIVAGLLMLGALGVGVASLPDAPVGPLMMVAVSCLLIGAVLLRLRLTAIDALADERARVDAVASTDLLTGVLTRRGLLSLVPGLAANAMRLGEPVCVIYADVRGLERANERYGIGYGDEVVRVVADVLTGIVRKGDLVSRWDGDKFLVAGLGNRPDPDVMRARIEGAVRLTGTALGRTPIEVNVGTASGDPASETFEELVHAGQADVTRAKARAIE